MTQEKENELQRLEKMLAKNMSQIAAKILVLSNKDALCQ